MRVKVIAVLALACCLTLARSVYAADAGLEFGVADDLTVLGNGGTAVDPDVEIKGFTVFGATQTSYTGISVTTGSVVVNGQLSVASGAYIMGGSTITGGAYFADVSTFASGTYFAGLSSFTAGPGSIYIHGGTGNQVLKKDPTTGAMLWADDQTGGASAINGTAGYLLYFKSGGGVAESVIWQDPSAHSATVLGSSLTIQGYSGDGLGVTGATKLNGDLSVTGVVTATGTAYLGMSTFTAAGNIYLASGSSITLTGNGAQIVLPNAPGQPKDAANKEYVDSRVGPWTRDDANIAVKLSTMTDNVGIGIALPRAKLHVASAAATNDVLLVVSTGSATTNQDVFGIVAGADGIALAGIKGNLAIGQTYSDSHTAPANGLAVQGAVAIGAQTAGSETGNMLKVQGASGAGQYIATFYSGTNLAAWVKQK